MMYLYLTQIIHENIVMRVGSAIKYGLLSILHSNSYGACKKVSERHILKRLQAVIDVLMNNPG